MQSQPEVMEDIKDIAGARKIAQGYLRSTSAAMVFDPALLTRPRIASSEELMLYHQLWRALLRGSLRIPPLPNEIVRLIFQAAFIVVPDGQRTHRATDRVLVRVSCRDEEPVASRVWFKTSPLDRVALAQIAAIQLVTISHDQGWVSPHTDICHSWFEWGIFPSCPDFSQGASAITGNESAWAKDASGNPMWRRTHGNPVAVGSYQRHVGPQIARDDELWDDVREGSVIVVRACAQEAMWVNDAAHGEILVWRWFEPVV